MVFCLNNDMGDRFGLVDTVGASEVVWLFPDNEVWLTIWNDELFPHVVHVVSLCFVVACLVGCGFYLG